MTVTDMLEPWHGYYQKTVHICSDAIRRIKNLVVRNCKARYTKGSYQSQKCWRRILIHVSVKAGDSWSMNTLVQPLIYLTDRIPWRISSSNGDDSTFSYYSVPVLIFAMFCKCEKKLTRKFRVFPVFYLAHPKGATREYQIRQGDVMTMRPSLPASPLGRGVHLDGRRYDRVAQSTHLSPESWCSHGELWSQLTVTGLSVWSLHTSVTLTWPDTRGDRTQCWLNVGPAS